MKAKAIRGDSRAVADIRRPRELAAPSSLILVVDDDPDTRGYTAALLRRAGHAVVGVSNGRDALCSIGTRKPDLVVAEPLVPGSDELGVTGEIALRWPELPIVAVSSSADVADVVRAVRFGAVDYVLKSSPPEAIVAAVRRVLAGASSVRDCPAVADIVGSSAVAVAVRSLVTLAAHSTLPVLIIGDTGTGKDLVSRTIHAASGVSKGPFVAHNCAATPTELFESEFFGHSRGAFTGADRESEGLLDQARSGVLFLDELDSMPFPHQAKLLRVLDDGEFRPVGSMRSRHSAIRVISALKREPADALAAGTLRRDLYYRLRGLEIRLPPLAARREDIGPLARHFLGAGAQRLAQEAVELLEEHPWPGNVRELRHTVHSALVFAGRGPILSIHAARALDRTATMCGPGGPAPSLRQAEDQLILQALEATRGNRTRAAKVLGVDRSTLSRKLRKFEQRPASISHSDSNT